MLRVLGLGVRVLRKGQKDSGFRVQGFWDLGSRFRKMVSRFSYALDPIAVHIHQRTLSLKKPLLADGLHDNDNSGLALSHLRGFRVWGLGGRVSLERLALHLETRGPKKLSAVQ